ncbi:hypothetical protein [Pseudomonas aeruginosa]|uniref:zinc finger-like domain-containing protein n=1 Tax=Pseudomonas aeruginosa TaxID=287 RepID=UPI002B25EA7F|nr:hypothetical protein [Pseudomonas aeruginosa]WOX87146.1 hypothetical protein PP477_23860 [Pseudomonas aeruginosa]
MNKALDLLREIRPSIPKEVLELWCKDRDAFLASHPAVEQAGGDERAVDGKPRATKCPDCGEGDLMPGDLCACGYETDPAAGYACSECDGSGDGYVGEVCRECDGSGWFVTPEQARAALAQPSPKCATCNGSKVVSTTDTDHNGDYIEAPCPKCGGTGEADSGGVHPWGEPVLIPCDCETEKAEAERPEVFGLERYRVEKTGQGFWPYCVRAGDGTRELFVGHLKQCKRVAAQLATAFEDGKFIAQHESIVGGLRAEITQLRQHKNDYMDAGQETYRALQNEIREREAEIARLDGLVSGRTAERDAALARVAELEQKSAGSWTVDTSCGRPILMYEGCSVIEDQTAYEVIRMIKWIGELERQEPVATVAKVPGEDWNSLDFHRDLQDMQPGTKFYAAPVAQAQQLHDLDKQCRDDVARALGLRPNQERGFAWSYLLASIKSCVKASEDSAQAQHSVPGDIMRDAQRYRWLRDQQFYFSFSTENSDAGISSCTAGMSSRFKNLSWVDAAIDSAIAAAPGKEGV